MHSLSRSAQVLPTIGTSLLWWAVEELNFVLGTQTARMLALHQQPLAPQTGFEPVTNWLTASPPCQ